MVGRQQLGIVPLGSAVTVSWSWLFVSQPKNPDELELISELDRAYIRKYFHTLGEAYSYAAIRKVEHDERQGP